MNNITANTPFQTTADKIALQTLTVPATLSYSVDCITWTQWKEQINDNNVVINNIPLGLYLRVDQDCIITDR